MSDWWSPADGDEGNDAENGGVEAAPGTAGAREPGVPASGAGIWSSTDPPGPPGMPAAGAPAAPPTAEPYQPVDFASIGQPTANVGTVENPKRSGLKSPLVLGGIAAGLLVVAMGTFTVFQFLGGGGAGSPEEVVTTLEAAINAQDPVLAATVIDPDELPMLVELMTEFEGARERTGLGGSGPVSGTDVEVTDLELDVDELAPNVARVTLTGGQLSAGYDVEDAPDPIRNLVDEDDRDRRESGSVSVDDYEDEVGAELSAIVVKKNRGWYISPSLTTADLLVEASNDDYKSGDFDEYGEVDFFAEGAESPAAVLEEISDAVASGDPEEVAAQLPSDQGQAAVVFQDAAEQLLSESTFSDDGDSGSFDRNRWKLGRTQTHTEKGPNGTTRLVIDSGKADVVDDDGDKYAVDSDGWKLCAKAPGDDRECVNVLTGETGDQDGWGSDAPTSDHHAEVHGDAPSLLMREVDGGWKLDPVATLLDLGVSYMRQIDQDTFEAATLLPIGDPDMQLKADQDEAQITFNDAGFASVEVPTKPNEIYSVVIDDVDPNWFGISNPGTSMGSGDSYVDNLGYLENDHDDDGVNRTFIATDESTVLGLGGLTNSLDKATVQVVEVEQGKGKLDEETKGSLKGPLALYRLPAEIGNNYELEFAASKEATIDVMDGDAELDSYSLSGGYSFDTTTSTGKDDPAESSFSADWSESLVVIRGEPGTSFSFRVTESPRGFEDGSTSKSVTVPGDGYIEVPFDLGGRYSQVYATVSWNTDADIDQGLTIDGSEEDSDASSQYSCPCSISLAGSGSNSGYIRLQSYRSYSVTVQLELTIE